MSGVFADAAIVACPVTNGRLSGGAQIVSFFQAVEQLLEEPQFDGDLSAFAAADSEGTRLLFGVANELPRIGPLGGLSAFQWDRGVLDPVLVTTPDALDTADRLERVGPPFVFVASVHPLTGAVFRFWSVPIWTEGVHLVFVESNYERNRAALLAASGVPFLKIQRRDDAVQWVARDDRLAHLAPSLSLKYRHDFAYIERGQLVIEEVSGYTADAGVEFKRRYHEHLEGKMEWLKAHRDLVVPRRVDGASLPRAEQRTDIGLWDRFLAP